MYQVLITVLLMLLESQAYKAGTRNYQQSEQVLGAESESEETQDARIGSLSGS